MGVFFDPNIPFEQGGGLTSKLIPHQLNKRGIAAGFGIMGAASIGREMFIQHNRMKMGPITYTGGPSRMTNNFSSGAVEAIQKVTKDPEVQADMLKKILRTQDGIINNLEEYGVDGDFLSAFYGMR